jgi:hypothetical protein
MALAVLSARASDQDESTLKTLFLEATTRFVTWPETAGGNDRDFADTTKPFIVGVAGDDKIVPIFNAVFSKNKIKHKPVIVKIVSIDSGITACHLLFIPSAKKNSIQEIINLISGKPILTLGDTPGFAEKGVIINLLLDKGEGAKVRFKINETSAQKSGLKLSYHLYKMGTIVHPAGATK